MPGEVLDDRLTLACILAPCACSKCSAKAREPWAPMRSCAACRLRPARGRVRSMPRYKLIIEYDGGPFVGWQTQANGESVQSALEMALTRFTSEAPLVHGAGRTDAGVHAMGQVAHLDLEREWDPEMLRNALNAHLRPHPISVLSALARRARFPGPLQRNGAPLSLSYPQSPLAAGARARPCLVASGHARCRGDARRGAPPHRQA